MKKNKSNNFSKNNSNKNNTKSKDEKNAKSKKNKKNSHKKNIIIISIIYILILLIGFSYSVFILKYEGSNNKFLAGEIYLKYLSDEIVSLENIKPNSSYDANDYFEFEISGKNTSNKDILYEISLGYGNDIENKMRLDDRFLSFKLVEIIDNQEVEIFTNNSYENINQTVIHVDGLPLKTYDVIKKVYRLYVCIDGVLIGNTSYANYTTEEWSKIYANITVNVSSSSNIKTYMLKFNPNRLPIDYQEVEYLESSGIQSIMTEIVPTNTTGIYLNYYNENIETDNVIFGVKDNDSNFLLGIKNNDLYYGWNDIQEITQSNNPNVKNNIELDIKNTIEFNYLNNRKIVVGNNVIADIKGELSNINLPLKIFALNNNGETSLNSSMKLYELKISESNEIKYHFLPCYRKSDNVKGLYDIINSKFYPNQSSEDFNIGENKIIKQVLTSDTYGKLLTNSFEHIYEFFEWNTETDGSGTSYKNDEIVNNIIPSGETIDLYAIWSNRLIIENIQILETKNATAQINSYKKLSFNSKVELSNQNVNDTYVTFKITLKNNSPYKYSFVDLRLGDENSNQDIFFILDGIKKGDLLESKARKNVNLTIKYADIENISNNIFNTELIFNFQNLSGINLKELILLNEEDKINQEDGLYFDNNRYYYSGTSVNNHIWFNCKDGYTSGEENCEKWRILSIENDGNIKIVKADVLEKDTIINLETKTHFWENNTSEWVKNTKIIAAGKIIFDYKGRRPILPTLENSYCINTKNGCNAFSSDTNIIIGSYKNLFVDADSLIKLYLNDVYYNYAFHDEYKEKLKIYKTNIGLIETNKNLATVLASESSIACNSYVSLLNVSDYVNASRTEACKKSFTNASCKDSNWLSNLNKQYHLINGKMVTNNDTNAQIWTIKADGTVYSQDSNNEFYMRPVIVISGDVIALGKGETEEYYNIIG